jgi:hypothetical protein
MYSILADDRLEDQEALNYENHYLKRRANLFLMQRSSGVIVQMIIKDTEYYQLRLMRLRRSGKEIADIIRVECAREDV